MKNWFRSAELHHPEMEPRVLAPRAFAVVSARRSACLAFACAAIAFGAPADAQPGNSTAEAEDAGPSPEAVAAHDEALERYKDGDFPAALVLFQKAYDLSPAFPILFNIARSARKTQDYKRSLETFRQYLEEGGDEIDAQRRAEVEETISELQGLVATLEIRVNVEGARIFVDDVEVGRSPLDKPIEVNAGPRRIRAAADGAEAIVQELDVAGGEARVVEFELDIEDEDPGPSRDGVLPGWDFPTEMTTVLWIATGALAVGAGVTGTIALVESSSLQDKRYPGPNIRPPADSDIKSQSDRIDTMATVTDWLIAGAVVSGVSAIYLSIAQATATEPEEQGSQLSPPPKTWLGIGPGGITIEGTF